MFLNGKKALGLAGPDGRAPTVGAQMSRIKTQNENLLCNPQFAVFIIFLSLLSDPFLLPHSLAFSF